MTQIRLVRGVCSRMMVLLTYLILFFLFYIIGGPPLTIIWFIVINIYVIVKLCAI
jgi:hypothetical protein